MLGSWLKICALSFIVSLSKLDFSSVLFTSSSKLDFSSIKLVSCKAKFISLFALTSSSLISSFMLGSWFKICGLSFGNSSSKILLCELKFIASSALDFSSALLISSFMLGS